jgi:flagellar hook-associated protein FlgK
MSNSEILGYSRQRVIQRDSWYTNIGNGANGYPLKRGSGTNWDAISQIRNEFLDLSYRTANSKLTFYSVKTTVGGEIEAQIGELQGADNFQSIIQDMWYSIEELTSHPQGVETRDFFLATCGAFVNKANEVYNGLFKYQMNLNEQVKQAVNDVNDTVGRIKELNLMIETAEISGDNANDYRDERNLCLDRLSELINVDYSYDIHGHVGIFSEGQPLLSGNSQSFLGLRYTANNYAFVEPVIVGGIPRDDILGADTPPSSFVQYINYDKPVNSDRNNDYGVLKGLLIARGAMPAYYLGKDGLEQPIPEPVPARLTVLSNADAATVGAYRNFLEDNFGVDFTAGSPVINEDDVAEYLLNQDPNKAFPAIITDDPVTQAISKQIIAIHNGLIRQHQAEAYNHKMQCWSIDYCMIPKTMIKLDQVFHSIVTMINDTVAPANAGGGNSNYIPAQENGEGRYEYAQNPDAPYDNNGNQSYVEVFIRSAGPETYIQRWEKDPSKPNEDTLYLVPEEEGNYYSQYSIGNVKINPELLNTEDGYNLLAFSKSGDIEDTRLLNELQQLWKSTESDYAVKIGENKFNMDEAYNKFVMQLSTEVAEAKSFVESQTVQVERAEYKRQTIMGVSMDEELNFMMKYQYAFQSAARILNVIDSMIDQVVNRTGRAGL